MEHSSRDPALLERRRRRGVALLRAGYSQVQVARHLEVSPAAVCQWKRAMVNGGEAALRSVARRGARQRVRPESVRLVQLLRSPEAIRMGFSGNLSSFAQVARFIESQFHVHYSRSGVWRLLKRFNSAPEETGPTGRLPGRQHPSSFLVRPVQDAGSDTAPAP